jgi:DNA polymerase-3 subunit alpha
VFALMAEFAGYGFAKSHSTAYALITYQTAYLRANHPREYLAALLTTESGNQDKLSRYIAHAHQRGIEILAPSINESASDFTVVKEGIRFGLSGVKNVGEGAIESILEVRARGGPFAGLYDFARRVDGRRVNRRVVESLVKCGAFDSPHPNRAAVWNALDAALEQGASAQRDREVGQGSLFGAGPGAEEPDRALPEAPPWTDAERLAGEKEVLGFYVTGHPLEAHAAALARWTDVSAGTAEAKVSREVRAGGVIGAYRETRTRKGQTMAFATLEDLEGSFELVIFPDTWTASREVLKRAQETGGDAAGALPLVAEGTLESAEPARILVRRLFPLADAAEHLAVRVHVRVRAAEATRDRLLALRSLLAEHAGDCGVVVHLLIPGESETLLALPDARGVDATPGLLRELDALFGRPVSELSL